jgi:hypothetical protein
VKKFKDDLRRALDNAGEFGVFAFFTNVRLTVGTRQHLIELGKAAGAVAAEVFDRENLRVALDSPEGLAARYQFLQIPLTDAEQASFFSRWGADLETLVTRSFAVVEDRLRRLEFMQEKNQPLANLGFHLVLKDSVSIAQLPHVRAFLYVAKLTRNVQRSRWNVGVCDNAPVRANEHCGTGPCLSSAFWLGDPAKTHGTAASSRNDPFKGVAANGGFSEFSEPKIVARLADLEDSHFAFFMNRALFDYVARIRMYANEYLIWSANSEGLSANAPNDEPRTPWSFTAAELSDPWVRVMPKGFTGSLHFSSTTPRRLWDAQGLDEPAV